MLFKNTSNKKKKNTSDIKELIQNPKGNLLENTSVWDPPQTNF